ncbi:MAG: thiosulfohydrolase SoxB [Alphaproteobacteria bacterium]|nr:thiosulfohydrolase SoxB [Alphaproteobacteria bacterium]
MLHRRHFFQAATAAAAIAAAAGLGPLKRVAAQQRLTQKDILAFPSLGTVTLLHVCDIHAQLMPLYFREPEVNLGPGEAKGKPPHLTDAAFRDYYRIGRGTAEAYALTSEDFAALAKNYGRMGGLDRIATVVKSARAERGDERVLFLDSGDTWQGSWTSLKTQGQDMIDTMALLKPDAMVGHWEFTYGAERVEQAAKALPFAFLAQNVRDAEWNETVFPARKMFERGGVKIAVIGQAFPYTPVANPRWMIERWEFGIRDEELQKHVDAARAEGAQLVVVLSHNGFDVDRKMAGRVRGIDVLLTGHTHDALPDVVKVGSTLLVASGSHGKFVSRLDIDVAGGKVKDYRYRLIPVFADAIAPDAEVAAAVKKARAPFERELGREIARTESTLYRRGNFNGTFDDLICQAMLAERDAEVALSPGFRWGGSLLAGDPITFEALTNATAITYPNCYRTTMSGAQLKDILEDVADNIFNPDPYYQGGGDMVRIGGIGFAIDIARPMGSRISDMTVLKTGKPVDPARGYAVSGWASVGENVEGPPIWEVVEKHLARIKTVRIEPNTAVKVKGA